jgi:hypothetical protein
VRAADSSSSSKKKAPQAPSAAASTSASLSRPPRPAPPPTRDEDTDENNAPVFIDRDGLAIRVMPWDYGFRSGAARTGGVVGGGSRTALVRLRSPSPVRVPSAAASSSADEEAESDDNNTPTTTDPSSIVRGKVPASLGAVARANFRAELFALRASFRRDDYKGIADAAAPTAGPLRRAAGAAGASAASALARADRALEEAGLLPRLELGSGTTVGAGATSAATANSDDNTSEECSVAEEQEEDDDAACAEPAWRRALRALDELTLDDHAVAARDRARDRALVAAARNTATATTARAPLLIRLPFGALCWLLDALYAGRPLQRFWVLETVARVPYFAYISVLHAYESVGLWRAGAELRRVHFAEEYNELHHLQIMVRLFFFSGGRAERRLFFSSSSHTSPILNTKINRNPWEGTASGSTASSPSTAPCSTTGC